MAKSTRHPDTERPFQKPPEVLAYRYAEAFRASISADKKSAAKNIKTAREELAAVDVLLTEESDFQAFMKNEALSREKKASIMAKITKKVGVKTVAPLLILLAQKGRLALLADVIRAFSDLDDRAAGLVPVNVSTADKLTAADQKEMSAAIDAGLKGKGAAKCAPVFRVDPSLIGGAVIHIGSKVFDLSIKGRLGRLHTSISERG